MTSTAVLPSSVSPVVGVQRRPLAA
uniref:Uncharacterized protein n=1 Tax=Arundo donax TaxID=35708 RepID=A0A0A9H7R1_ARUDO